MSNKDNNGRGTKTTNNSQGEGKRAVSGQRVENILEEADRMKMPVAMRKRIKDNLMKLDAAAGVAPSEQWRAESTQHRRSGGRGPRTPWWGGAAAACVALVIAGGAYVGIQHSGHNNRVQIADTGNGVGGRGVDSGKGSAGLGGANSATRVLGGNTASGLYPSNLANARNVTDVGLSDVLGFTPMLPSTVPAAYALGDVNATTSIGYGNDTSVFSATYYLNSNPAFTVIEVKATQPIKLDAATWTPVDVNGTTMYQNLVQGYHLQWDKGGTQYQISSSNALFAKTLAQNLILHLDTALTTPTAGVKETVNRAFTGLQNASDILSFTPVLPSFTAPGYSNTDTYGQSSFSATDRQDALTITYTNGNKSYTVMEWADPLPAQAVPTASSGYTISKTTIEGVNCTLARQKYAKDTMIYWEDKSLGMWFQVNGPTTTESILKQVTASLIQVTGPQ